MSNFAVRKDQSFYIADQEEADQWHFLCREKSMPYVLLTKNGDRSCIYWDCSFMSNRSTGSKVNLRTFDAYLNGVYYTVKCNG